MFTFESIVAIFILILTIVLRIVATLRDKMTRGNFTEKIQKPGQFVTFFSWVMNGLSLILGILTILAIFINEGEMALVCSIITVIFMLIAVGIKRKYDMTYQETAEYFTVASSYNSYTVYYEDITHWVMGTGTLSIRDKSMEDDEFVNISLRLFKPEILLTNIIAMTFNNEFPRIDGVYPDETVYPNDPMRKQEIVTFLRAEGYDYLLDDFDNKK